MFRYYLSAHVMTWFPSETRLRLLPKISLPVCRSKGHLIRGNFFLRRSILAYFPVHEVKEPSVRLTVVIQT